MALTNKLTTIADAIRSKTGGTDLLSLDGMVNAIEGIQTGGGDSQAIIDSIIDGTVTEVTTYATKVRTSRFDGAYMMTNINMPNVTKIETNAFQWCAALVLTSLPEGLATIGNGSFRGCTSITEMTFPSSLTNLANNSFTSCSKLTTVTFKSTPRIENGAFGSCSELTTINVPWAEGAVSGAPWGAYNATINYNYTGA